MTAPNPVEIDRLSDAWNDPIRFAAELARYYDQLRAAGLRDDDRKDAS